MFQKFMSVKGAFHTHSHSHSLSLSTPFISCIWPGNILSSWQCVNYHVDCLILFLTPPSGRSNNQFQPFVVFLCWPPLRKCGVADTQKHLGRGGPECSRIRQKAERKGKGKGSVGAGGVMEGISTALLGTKFFMVSDLEGPAGGGFSPLFSATKWGHSHLDPSRGGPGSLQLLF